MLFCFNHTVHLPLATSSLVSPAIYLAKQAPGLVDLNLRSPCPQMLFPREDVHFFLPIIRWHYWLVTTYPSFQPPRFNPDVPNLANWNKLLEGNLVNISKIFKIYRHSDLIILILGFLTQGNI